MKEAYKSFLGKPIDMGDPFVKETIKNIPRYNGWLATMMLISVVAYISIVVNITIFLYSIVTSQLNYRIGMVIITALITYVPFIAYLYLIKKRSKVVIWWTILGSVGIYVITILQTPPQSFTEVIIISCLLFIPTYFLISRKVAIVFRNKIEKKKK